MPLRLVFAGTPEPALPALAAIAASPHDLLAVVTRPDAPSGRGRRLTPSPVAVEAERLGVPVLKPEHPRDEDFQATLRDLAPDCCPVVAYGALLPASALEIPPLGWVNLHFSLLPAWRGAAPVQRALAAGEEITGATTFRIVPALDAGPTFGVMTERVRPRDTAGDLLARLAVGGADLLLATLDGLDTGAVEARAQPTDGVSLAPKVTVADAEIDWQRPAAEIDRLVRAWTPAPGAWTTYAGQRFKIGPVTLVEESVEESLAPGQIRAEKRRVLVGTGRGTVALGDVQPTGKRPMPAADWARGVAPHSFADPS